LSAIVSRGLLAFALGFFFPSFFWGVLGSSSTSSAGKLPPCAEQNTEQSYFVMWWIRRKEKESSAEKLDVFVRCCHIQVFTGMFCFSN